MQNLNIFIGSTARRWSESISGNKLLLGNNLDKEHNESIITPQDFPTSEIYAHSKADECWKQMSNNFSLYIESQKQNNLDYLSKIEVEINKYNNVNLIAASGGLFGNTFTPLVLSILKRKNKNVQLIIQKTNIGFLKKKEEMLINHIKQNSNVSCHFIELDDLKNKFGNEKLDVVFNVLDELVITQINHQENFY